MISKQHTSILLLTNQLETSPTGGREMLCKLNYDVLSRLYGSDLFVFELAKQPIHKLMSVINAFKGHIDGVSNESIDSALQVISAKNVVKVFVDGSGFGEIVKRIKIEFPLIQILTFFHNVEARFFWGSWRLHGTIHALGVMLVNTLAERKAVRYSDKIICLSERDSALLRRIYGRGATHISPMVLEDKFTASFSGLSEHTPERFALFVGGTFYANRAGIQWFVHEVVPQIDLPIYIVGRGFEALKKELEIPGKVVVVGAVDSLEEWYHRAFFVIAPIFSGSGMKTKVAEALMFGKKVIGTPEAFSGYDEILSFVGRVCTDKDEFIAAIRHADEMVSEPFDAKLRSIYEKKYSFVAAVERFKVILNVN
jgi:glycosyltransferase involved in cell wall biosynthesis